MLHKKCSLAMSNDALLEYWYRVACSISSRRSWTCIFRNWSQLGLKIISFCMTLEFTLLLKIYWYLGSLDETNPLKRVVQNAVNNLFYRFFYLNCCYFIVNTRASKLFLPVFYLLTVNKHYSVDRPNWCRSWNASYQLQVHINIP